MAYDPIESYGLIGNMRTAALVGPTGSIDWLCLPWFDSPSLFGALLDDRRGGRFTIAAAHPDARARQYYWPETNVLITHFRIDGGAAEVVDFMPVGVPKQGQPTPDLIRIVRAIHGTTPMELLLTPAFDYARRSHRIVQHDAGVIVEADGEALVIASTHPLVPTDTGLTAHFEVAPGRHAVFALWHRTGDEEREPAPVTPEFGAEILEHTIRFWRSWVSRSTYTGRWREVVQRSALALKLLTFEPTGAIIAAPTTSLPENIGGTRNWDYRCTWLRDAAFTLFALQRIGYTSEAAAFFGWLEQRCHELEPGRMLQPVYSIHGGHDMPEATLDHLDGYRGSRPVRIGNAAATQTQLDAYGVLLDAVYLHNKHALPISYDLWRQLRTLVNWIAEHWTDPDRSIWEVRGQPRHFVYSKLMSWVALDRARRLAESRSFPAELDHWRDARDRVHDAIMTHGWNPEHRAFVQYFGAETLDAANLLMSQVYFLGPADPRVLGTIDAISRPPADGGLLEDFLVYRYNAIHTDDGLCGEPEGGFNMCTFWLIEALTRAGRIFPSRLERARLLFERMLARASPLGLFAEQTAPTGDALGNYPQALTHLSLISAALGLDRALNSGKR